jgi:hypothetical protein
MDDSGDETCVLWSALVIPDHLWRSHLKSWIGWRKTLLRKYGVPVNYEIHSQEWLSRNPVPITGVDGTEIDITTHSKESRRDRSFVFEKSLKIIGSFAGAKLLTCHAPNTEKAALYGECLSWIEEFLELENDMGLVILDGRDQGYHYRNHHRLLPLKTRRVLEDPTEMPSKGSHWIQMADICAHAAFQSIRQNPKRSRQGQIAYETHLQRIIHCHDGDGPRGIRGA